MFNITTVDHYFNNKMVEVDINQNRVRKRQSFKSRTLERRKEEAEETKKRYPTKLPLVVERYRGEKAIPDMDKVKWLVPHQMNVLQLMAVLKQRLKLANAIQLFLFIDGKTIPAQLVPMTKLYEQFADPDGFLYFTYSSQECLG